MSTEIVLSGVQKMRPDWEEEVKGRYSGLIKVVVFREGRQYHIQPYNDSLSGEEIDSFRREGRRIIEIIPGVNREGLDVIGRMVYNFTQTAKKSGNVDSIDYRLSEGLMDEFFERA